MVKSALFVCLGNTCRSPIAEAVFLDILKKRGLENEWKVDSAAIADWHVGKPANGRSIYTLEKYNLKYEGRARQIEEADFGKFDYIFGMDQYNIYELEELKPSESQARILLLGEFDPSGEKDIRDPYCDQTMVGFEKCYQQCVRSCTAFLDSLN